MSNITHPLEMIWTSIPAGTFVMGSSQKQIRQIKQLDPDYSDEWLDREQPQHEVYLSQFEIGVYPVTNRQFREFVNSTEYQTERELDGLGKSIWYQFPFGRQENSPSMEEMLDHPVVCVTVSDVLTYCQWFSQQTGDKVNLPTEGQWEKASRGEDDRMWSWGDQFEESNCNITGKGTTVVGSYPQGVSPYGVMDCAGNVWEWCRDWFSPDYYHHSPNRDPLGPEGGEYYVVRGGSWYRGRRSIVSTRTSARFRHFVACYTFGFRLVRESS